MKDQELNVSIEGDELVIRIGMDSLVVATECSPVFGYNEDGTEKIKVLDKNKWVKEVVECLNSESEDGTTFVHEMFDKAFESAIEDGAEGADIIDDGLVKCKEPLGERVDDIETNDRFDKLTNHDISVNYRDKEYFLSRSNFNAAFAYWVVAQSPYNAPDITEALTAFDKYIGGVFTDKTMNQFSYGELNDILSSDIFESIPEIEKLNHRKNGRAGHGFCSAYDQPDLDDDFIDLGALSRNVFYMILREYITQR